MYNYLLIDIRIISPNDTYETNLMKAYILHNFWQIHVSISRI